MSKQPVSRKKRIFDIIQIGNTEDFPSRAFDIFIVIAIVLNILVMLLSTFDSLSPLRPLFQVLELCTIGIFSVEYILRIWTADLLYPAKSPLGLAAGRQLLLLYVMECGICLAAGAVDGDHMAERVADQPLHG